MHTDTIPSRDEYLLFTVFTLGILWYLTNQLSGNKKHIKQTAIVMVSQWIKTISQPESRATN